MVISGSFEGCQCFLLRLFFNLTFAGGSSAVRQVWSKTSVHSLKMTFDPFSRTLNSFQPEFRGIGDVDAEFKWNM